MRWLLWHRFLGDLVGEVPTSTPIVDLRSGREIGTLDSIIGLLDGDRRYVLFNVAYPEGRALVLVDLALFCFLGDVEGEQVAFLRVITTLF